MQRFIVKDNNIKYFLEGVCVTGVIIRIMQEFLAATEW